MSTAQSPTYADFVAAAASNALAVINKNRHRGDYENLCVNAGLVIEAIWNAEQAASTEPQRNVVRAIYREMNKRAGRTPYAWAAREAAIQGIVQDVSRAARNAALLFASQTDLMPHGVH